MNIAQDHLHFITLPCAMPEEKLQTDMEATLYMKIFIGIVLFMASINHYSTSYNQVPTAHHQPSPMQHY